MSIAISDNVAYGSKSGSAIYFSSTNPSKDAGVFKSTGASETYLPIKKLQNVLGVAYWGEDNRFPQNIENQLEYCGVAQSALNFRSKIIGGNGIIAGKITGYKDDGTEIFVPITYDIKNPVIKLIESSTFKRSYIEFLQDFVKFGNCFPEMIFSNNGKLITGFTHQESCDGRFKQMGDDGKISKVFLSKLWGSSKDQYSKFDPKKWVMGLIENPKIIYEVDNIFVKELDCIDMYNPVESAKSIALNTEWRTELKSAILPVNYPSTNKTYYQVPFWDGARLGGWIEIASKIPQLYKTMYNNAFNIKYHIEVPDTYFSDLYGKQEWTEMSPIDRQTKRKKLADDMDEYLSGSDNAYKTLVTTFYYDSVNKQDYGHIKIAAIENKSNIDKDLVASSAATDEILMSMQTHPALFKNGMTGSRSGGGSGSNIREAFLIQIALLKQERDLALEPLNLIRDYNIEVGNQSEWENVVFKFRDTILTTLDTGAGTSKTIS